MRYWFSVHSFGLHGQNISLPQFIECLIFLIESNIIRRKKPKNLSLGGFVRFFVPKTSVYLAYARRQTHLYFRVEEKKGTSRIHDAPALARRRFYGPPLKRLDVNLWIACPPEAVDGIVQALSAPVLLTVQSAFVVDTIECGESGRYI